MLLKFTRDFMKVFTMPIANLAIRNLFKNTITKCMWKSIMQVEKISNSLSLCTCDVGTRSELGQASAVT